MAEFTLDTFSTIGGQSRRGNALQSFSYSTPDTLTEVKASGYFDELTGLLSADDQITVAVETGGAVKYAIIFVQDAGLPVTIRTVDINAV